MTNNHNIIYVGIFDNNKNVLRLAEAVQLLRAEFPDVCLHLVGKGGVQEAELERLAHEQPGTFVKHGPIYDKERLRELYRRCSVFAMPSIHETFGLVYLEAMSQGLAVVFTRGQGIDGMFSEAVGEAVDARSVASIHGALSKMFGHREAYNSRSVDFEQFRWERIAERYKGMYEGLAAHGN